MTGAKPFQF